MNQTFLILKFKAIANATLTVNEFHAMTLATGNPDTKWSRTSVVAVVFILILAIFPVSTTMFYIFCVRKRSKAQIAEMEQFIGPVKKRVILFPFFFSAPFHSYCFPKKQIWLQLNKLVAPENQSHSC